MYGDYAFSITYGIKSGIIHGIANKDANMKTDKVRTNRLRRWAKRLGMSLHRSRKRYIHAYDRGEYTVRNDKGLVVTGWKFDLSLDEVEEVLREIEQKLVAERRA